MDTKVNSSSPSINRLEPPSQLHPRSETPSPTLPEIPAPELDLTFSLDAILSLANFSEPQVEKVQKRASNVMKLTQENEKLKEELKAMTARLEAAERKRLELASKFQQQQSSTAQPNRS